RIAVGRSYLGAGARAQVAKRGASWARGGHLTKKGPSLTLRPPLAAAALAVALVADASPATAAGTYSVFSCQGPKGVPNLAPGWTGFASAIPDAVFGNDCASGGTLYAALPAGANGGRVARWRFEAPPDIRIVRIRAARRTTGLAKSEQATDVGYSLTTDPAPGIIETCDTGQA